MLLAPGDAFSLGIDPNTIVSGKKPDFLNVEITMTSDSHSGALNGCVRILARSLALTPMALQRLKLSLGDRVQLAARTARPLVYLDVEVTSDMKESAFCIACEEAQAGCLVEGDSVELVSGAALTTLSNSGGSKEESMPERFLPMRLKPKGPNASMLITESDIWNAIKRKKRVWVPKHARITPAALELGKTRGLFEFE